MNRLSMTDRATIIQALCEGNSIRATCRMTGAAKWTVVRLLVSLGTVAADYQDANLRNLACKRLQADEIWTFIRAKDRTVKRATKPMPADAGDVWTWVAIDRDTSLSRRGPWGSGTQRRERRSWPTLPRGWPAGSS